MGTVNVVGPEGSGRLTFLAFLYAAMVRAGGESAEGFRFRVDPASVDVVGPLFEQVRAGDPPRLDPPGALPEIRLEIEFSGATSGHWSWRPHGGSLGGGVRLACALRRWGFAELEAFIRSGGALDEAGSRLLDGGLLVMTVDASRIPVGRGPHPADPLYAGLLDTVFRTARDHPSPMGRHLSPLIVLTKGDQFSDGGLELGLKPPFPTLPLKSDREAFAVELLDRHLPQTALRLRGPAPAGLNVDRPTAVVTWITPSSQGSGPVRLQGALTPTRGWEPNYPYTEFLAVLQRLHGVAVARGTRGET